MNNKTLNEWIMYHEIHKLSGMGFSNAKIGRYLIIDPRTVKKILSFDQNQYEQYLINTQSRTRKLAPYEAFVRQKLEQFNETPSAQMHDWLKEAYPDLTSVSERTVFNFVMYVRQKYNIPIQKAVRQYFPVEELPFGRQAQVDFGEYNMRTDDSKRKKIYFFAMVLSRSRMKYVWFRKEPFTAETVCQAHEKAFSFFDGIPSEIVYDQDKTMLVDEHGGVLILTAAFRQYTRARSFNLHFCRKADPESKGKIENVIGYTKKNFLFNRTYSDIEALNNQALAWLSRTANALKHNLTKKVPAMEFVVEQSFLKNYIPIPIPNNDQVQEYHVRKTNTINYKSNFYSLPYGTYDPTGIKVSVKENGNQLEIYSLEGSLLCTHELCVEKGKTIINNNHKRNTSESVVELMDEVLLSFNDKTAAKAYIEQIRAYLPRYIRDHLLEMKKALGEPEVVTPQVGDKALAFCIKNNLYSGYEFRDALQVFNTKAPAAVEEEIILLNKDNLSKANLAPQTSDINDYENIINS